MDQPAAVVLDGVTMLRQEQRILDDVSGTLPAGRCTALLGPNGCGKTTLTRILMGMLWPTRGSVRVLGETLGSTDVRALRRRIGLVHPASARIDLVPATDPRLSALDTVLTGIFGTVGLYDADQLTADDRARAAHGLQSVGLAGHETQAFGTLSTGEQRRVLVARALIRRPELLILDEPTAGLDIAGREQVLATIQRILESKDPPTVLMITHHVEEISPLTAQVILMREGRLTASGPPESTITSARMSETFSCPVDVRRTHGRGGWKCCPRLGWICCSEWEGSRPENRTVLGPFGPQPPSRSRSQLGNNPN